MPILQIKHENGEVTEEEVISITSYLYDGYAEQGIIFTKSGDRYHAMKYTNETVWKTDYLTKLIKEILK